MSNKMVKTLKTIEIEKRRNNSWRTCLTGCRVWLSQSQLSTHASHADSVATAEKKMRASRSTEADNINSRQLAFFERRLDSKFLCVETYLELPSWEGWKAEFKGKIICERGRKSAEEGKVQVTGGSIWWLVFHSRRWSGQKSKCVGEKKQKKLLKEWTAGRVREMNEKKDRHMEQEWNFCWPNWKSIKRRSKAKCLEFFNWIMCKSDWRSVWRSKK